MTEQTFTEAPASINFRATNGNGFTVQFTMRNGEMGELVKRVEQLTAHLLASGWTAQGNGNEKAAPKLENGQTDPAWCPIHGCAMKRREKDGQVWYSHKVGDDWCRGK